MIQFDWPAIGKSFLRSLVPVALTYSATIAGIKYFGAVDADFAVDQNIGIFGLLIVPLFTLSHAVVPVFFYRIFFGAIGLMRSQFSQTTHRPLNLTVFIWAFSGFVYLHMGLWFGIPTIALAFLTGWLTIPAAAVHMLFAPKGSKVWVFLEYGSTSFALLLFVVFYSGENLFPFGVFVVLFQILLLTIIDWKARGLWVRDPNEEPSNSEPKSMAAFFKIMFK